MYRVIESKEFKLKNKGNISFDYSWLSKGLIFESLKTPKKFITGVELLGRPHSKVIGKKNEKICFWNSKHSLSGKYFEDLYGEAIQSAVLFGDCNKNYYRIKRLLSSPINVTTSHYETIEYKTKALSQDKIIQNRSISFLQGTQLLRILHPIETDKTPDKIKISRGLVFAVKSDALRKKYEICPLQYLKNDLKGLVAVESFWSENVHSDELSKLACSCDEVNYFLYSNRNEEDYNIFKKHFLENINARLNFLKVEKNVKIKAVLLGRMLLDSSRYHLAVSYLA